MRKYDGYLKSGDVAQIMGVSKSTIKGWDTRKVFVADKRTSSNLRLYKLESVQKFMQEYMIVGGM